MASFGKVSTATKAMFSRDFVIAALAAFLVLLSARSMAADPAPTDKLSDGDKTCLGCHGSEGLQKDLGGGKLLSLQVAGDKFAQSVHGAIGCASCHAEIDLKTHPQNPKTIANGREYAIAMARICGGCHAEEQKQYETSVHAKLLAGGNHSAPVCTDCHGNHDVTPRTAYETCVGCHSAAMDAHKKWLPNAGLHLEVVSCAACHAPSAQRMVDLRLYDRETKKWVAERQGLPEFENMAHAADPDGHGLDAIELRRLMAQLNHGETKPHNILRGRIELRNPVEAHQLAGKDKAIKDCASCHRQGAEPFQNVTVSILSADGSPLRYQAQKEVLSSALSVDSLREFYAVGGTRSMLLDALLVLAVLAGLAVPIGHQILKRIVKKQLERDAQAGASTKPDDHGRA